MSTPPGWEPRPGPTRGDPARRAPRGPGGLARDDADPRRQGGRGSTSAVGGRGDGREAGPSFTPGRAPGPREGGPAGSRAPRGAQGRPFRNPDGNDRRGPLPDDFAGRQRSSGEGRPVPKTTAAKTAAGRGGPAGDRIGSDGFQSAGPARWLGRMPTWTAMLVLAVGAVLGVVATLAAGQEPGVLLGFFVVAGTIGAALCIRRGRVYLLFPAPALALFVAAIATGKVHDAKLGSSTAGLAASFTQWVAGIFFPAVVATVVVLLVGGGRWLLGRQLVTGQSPLSVAQPASGKTRPAPRDRRPVLDEWADDNPFVDPSPRPAQGGSLSRQGTGPSPGQGTGPSPAQGTGPSPRQGTGPSPRQGTGTSPRQGTGASPRQGTGSSPRQGTGASPAQGTGSSPRQGTAPAQGGPNGSRPGRPRDQRTDRDPWSDPRLPADRSQPTGSRPHPSGQDRPAPQSGSGPRPSWNPAPGPAPKRPQRRQPPEDWSQR
jgi:hypothetical protein